MNRVLKLILILCVCLFASCAQAEPLPPSEYAQLLINIKDFFSMSLVLLGQNNTFVLGQVVSRLYFDNLSLCCQLCKRRNAIDCSRASLYAKIGYRYRKPYTLTILWWIFVSGQVNFRRMLRHTARWWNIACRLAKQMNNALIHFSFCLNLHMPFGRHLHPTEKVALLIMRFESMPPSWQTLTKWSSTPKPSMTKWIFASEIWETFATARRASRITIGTFDALKRAYGDYILTVDRNTSSRTFALKWALYAISACNFIWTVLPTTQDGRGIRLPQRVKNRTPASALRMTGEIAPS